MIHQNNHWLVSDTTSTCVTCLNAFPAASLHNGTLIEPLLCNREASLHSSAGIPVQSEDVTHRDTAISGVDRRRYNRNPDPAPNNGNRDGSSELACDSLKSCGLRKRGKARQASQPSSGSLVRCCRVPGGLINQVRKADRLGSGRRRWEAATWGITVTVVTPPNPQDPHQDAAMVWGPESTPLVNEEASE